MTESVAPEVRGAGRVCVCVREVGGGCRRRWETGIDSKGADYSRALEGELLLGRSNMWHLKKKKKKRLCRNKPLAPPTPPANEQDGKCGRKKTCGWQ